MTEVEIWKPVPGYGGHYEASSLGRIKSKERYVKKKHRGGAVMSQFYNEKILTATIGAWGHYHLHISVNAKKYSVAVHRLVLLAFAGPCPEGMEACHNDGNPSNNRPENLRWDTHYNNNQDRKRHGRYASGSEHPMAKLTDRQAAHIKYGGITLREAKRLYNVCTTSYYRIKHNESWVGL